MSIAGKFTRVSKSDYRDGVVLVAVVGNVWPHDLRPEEIKYIKVFYNMPESEHKFYAEWPEGVEPWYPAAKKNFKNGYIFLKNKGE